MSAFLGDHYEFVNFPPCQYISECVGGFMKEDHQQAQRVENRLPPEKKDENKKKNQIDVMVFAHVNLHFRRFALDFSSGRRWTALFRYPVQRLFLTILLSLYVMLLQSILSKPKMVFLSVLKI